MLPVLPPCLSLASLNLQIPTERLLWVNPTARSAEESTIRVQSPLHHRCPIISFMFSPELADIRLWGSPFLQLGELV